VQYPEENEYNKVSKMLFTAGCASW